MPTSKQQSQKNRNKNKQGRGPTKATKLPLKSQHINGASVASKWDEFIGMFRDDPDFQDVKAHIERSRRKK